jgi:hypothetical protein
MSMRVKSTIQDVISAGKELKLCNRELSLKSVLTNSNDEKFIINITNVFEQYYEILLENTVIVTLTDEEYLKYRFKPKVLSFDLYGTIELHYLLLRLNHVYSVINFDFTELRVFNTNIIDLLNEILVLENDNLIGNEVDVIKEINE